MTTTSSASHFSMSNVNTTTTQLSSLLFPYYVFDDIVDGNDFFISINATLQPFNEFTSYSSHGMIGINLYNNTTFTNEFKNISSLTRIILLAVAMFSLSFLTVLGNTIVIYALRTNRHLRTVGNLFILSLATADLIVGCFVMPIAGIYAIMEEWKMGLVVCQIWISVDFIASTASIFNLLTLSLDRYWSITSPLQYLGKRTRTRALLLIGFAWGLSLLWVIPIVGWHAFVNKGQRLIDDNKCEPEYTNAKVFKVSTALINFYVPLLVLISLNGRIYYEIKRRYKNVLLQRHSNKTNNSIINNNSLYNHKLNRTRNTSRSPVTVTLCDSDRQLCSTTINYTENDSLVLSKYSPKSPINTNNDNNESILRINFKEKKSRPIIPISTYQKSSLKRTYSYSDKNHCTQDELTWFAHRHEHTHSSFIQRSPTIRSNYKYNHTHSHRLQTNQLGYKHTNDYNSNRIYSNKNKVKRHSANPSSFYNHHPTTLLCRHCSLLNSIKPSTSLTPTTTTMNVFNLCHCCSAATSAITIHSNPFINTTINSNIESRKVSSSSSSSVAPSPTNRKQQQQQQQQPLSSSTHSSNRTTSSLIPRANSQHYHYRTANKVKQTTVWNQQEKAFRQLFAIVFGFTCCFLPYFILYMVVAFCGECVSERIVTASIWLGYVNSTMNPFLYALSNKHFRRTFNRLLKRNNRRQSYYN